MSDNQSHEASPSRKDAVTFGEKVLKASQLINRISTRDAHMDSKKRNRTIYKSSDLPLLSEFVKQTDTSFPAINTPVDPLQKRVNCNLNEDSILT